MLLSQALPHTTLHRPPSSPSRYVDSTKQQQLLCKISNLLFVVLVSLSNFLQDINFQSGCFSVLSHISNDFQRHLGFTSAEGKMTQEWVRGGVAQTTSTNNCPQAKNNSQFLRFLTQFLFGWRMRKCLYNKSWDEVGDTGHFSSPPQIGSQGHAVGANHSCLSLYQ